MASSKSKWYVTFADARGKLCMVWLQSIDSSDFSHVIDFMGDVDGKFSALASKETNKTFCVGELCIAKYSEDQKCYRARIVRTGVPTEEGIPGVQVAFIDYGNIEIVTINNIIRAGMDIFAIPPLATMFSLADIQPANGEVWSSAEVEKLKLNMLDKEVVGELLSPSRPGVAGTMRLFDAKTMQPLVESHFRTGIGKKYDNAHLHYVQFKMISLKIGTNYPVVLSNFESPYNFWVHVTEQKQQLDSILSSLQKTPCVSMNEYEINMGKVCVAKCEKPGGQSILCRAVITNIYRDLARCSVYLVDYGANVDCILNYIYLLPEIFANIPAFAVNCSLISREAAALSLQNILATNNILIVGQVNGIYQVSKSITNREILADQQSSIMPHAQLAKEVVNVATPQRQLRVDIGTAQVAHTSIASVIPPSDGTKLASIPLNLGEIYDVQVVSVEDTGLFYCHLAQNNEKFATLKQHLLTMRLVPIQPPFIMGTTCIVKRSSDGLPCRAQILSVASGSIHVKLVDFGNIENAVAGTIYQTSDELTRLPSFAVYCTLVGSADIPLQSLVKLLRKYEEKGGICARFVTKKDGIIYEVEVFDSISRVVTLIEDEPKDQSMSTRSSSSKTSSVTSPSINNVQSPIATHLSPKSATLKQSDTLVTLALDVGRREKLYITAVYSGSEFFGQLSCYSPDLLESLQEELNSFHRAGKGRTLVRSTPGTLCVAEYSGDGNYYRARLLKSDNKIAQLIYIDYGNLEDKLVQELFELETKFSRLPIQGIKCRTNATQVPLDKLSAAIMDTELHIVVEGREGDVYIVSLPHCSENTNVNKLLQR